MSSATTNPSPGAAGFHLGPPAQEPPNPAQETPNPAQGDAMTVLTARLVDNKGPESVARLVLAKHADVSWATALDHSVQWWNGFSGGTTSATNAWQSLNQSLTPPYLLVFNNGKVQTLYGLRFRVTTRSVALMGERRIGSVATINLQMYQHAGALATQAEPGLGNTIQFTYDDPNGILP